jgi:hypothetical protein
MSEKKKIKRMTSFAIAYGKDGKCALCGKVDELRPYGPNDEWICFECGMKDEKTTKKKFENILEKSDVVVIGVMKR